MKQPNVKIIPFEEQYAPDFAAINYWWLEKYFTIEQHDRIQLDDPYTTIIKPGGQIFFALVEGKAVGTVGLQVHNGDYELIKMGVLPEYKGLRIGEMLVDAAIDYASKKRNIKKIILGSNTKLQAALHLYRKAGFKEIPPDPNSPYQRCDIWMEKVL